MTDALKMAREALASCNSNEGDDPWFDAEKVRAAIAAIDAQQAATVGAPSDDTHAYSRRCAAAEFQRGPWGKYATPPAVQAATVVAPDYPSMIRWLQESLRDFGHCPDGGKCHHQCKSGSANPCARQAKCVPLTGSGLANDWSVPVATPPAVQAPAPLPARFVLFTLRDLRAERKRLDGFLSLGNEIGRAAEYDEWITALEAYAAFHDIGAAAQGGE